MSDISIDAAGLDEEIRARVLAPDAVEFVTELHRRFDAERLSLLAAREQRRQELRRGGTLDFLPETADVRNDSWRVAPPRPDYLDRRVEITGPTDRKLVINALNSGAAGFMADFEDASAPTWSNQVSGHANLADAIDGTISYESADGRKYSLDEKVATLIVRPRGWHLDEKHFRVGEQPLGGAFLDFGLYAFHCAAAQLQRGSAPYFYLPKLEHYLEARLWSDVFGWSEEALGIPHGSIRATVLIETLPASFQMEEMLFELRDHSYGLNAGRWDYIFSTIKCFPDRPEFVLPDRNDIKMTVPFMASYAKSVVAACHSRGAFAMGGMAALIPSRTDEEANQRAVEAVRADKEREAGLGFDGTWVAHPDVVAVARAAFDAVLGEEPNQIDRALEVERATAVELLDIASTPGSITEAGLRGNINVAFQYISFWLGGRGAAGINNLMEDAATAEISRSQVWQWARHGSQLSDGRTVTRELIVEILDEEMAKIRSEVGEETWQRGRPDDTRGVFEQVALADELPEFLTVVAYDLLE